MCCLNLDYEQPGMPFRDSDDLKLEGELTLAIQVNVAQQGPTGFQNSSASSGRSVGTAQADQDAKAADVVHEPSSADTASDASQTGRPVEAHRLESAIKTLAEKLPLSANELQFSVDENSGKTIVVVIDPQTEEVIRQLPPEEALHMARALEELGELDSGTSATPGMLVDGEA